MEQLETNQPQSVPAKYENENNLSKWKTCWMLSIINFCTLYCGGETVWWCICDTYFSSRQSFIFPTSVSSPFFFMYHVSQTVNSFQYYLVYLLLTLMGRSCNSFMKNGNESPKKNLLQYYCKLYYCINYKMIYIYSCTICESVTFNYPYLFTFIQRKPTHRSCCISLDLYAINTI